MKWTTLTLAAMMLPATLAMPAVAQTSGYPSKTITIVVPFPAGSTADAIPRLVAPLVSKELGQTVIIENRGGANGSIGAARVATAPGDGHTILLATTGMLAINQWIYEKQSYNPSKDFTPITNGAVTPNILVVNPSIKATNLKELVEVAKAEPGKLTFSSAGIGSTSHLCGETLKVLENINAVHVPYQGAAPALQDVIGGQVSMMCDNLSNVVQQVNSGTLRPIVVTANEPNAQLPNVPTAKQAGNEQLLAGNWYGFVVPSSTPKDIVEKLNKTIVAALNDATVKARLEGMGLTVIADKPEEFAATISKDAARMEEIVKRANLKIKN